MAMLKLHLSRWIGMVQAYVVKKAWRPEIAFKYDWEIMRVASRRVAGKFGKGTN